ncbi:unnamed protein product [Symbiodinium sp. CCMP2592]|nr:unnamed protein product [Symbiodinium sp. CCMP2592]
MSFFVPGYDDVPVPVGKPCEESPPEAETADLILQRLRDVYISMEAVRPDLIRGMWVAQGLQHLPWWWLRGRVDSLYSLSEASGLQLDEFWSHSWRGSAWAKYLNVLFLNNNLVASVVGTLAAILAYALYELEALPDMSSALLGLGNIWSVVCGTVAYCAALLLTRGRRLVFLDVVCINQHDRQEKMLGLISMGAILKGSRSMLVLWHRTYVARLWCVFELGAFLHSRERSTKPTITVCPPFLGPAFLGGELGVALMAAMFLAAGNSLGFASPAFWIAFGAAFVASLTLLAHTVRGYCRDICVMQHQLATFAIDQAVCECCSQHKCDGLMLCDRDVIVPCISAWFGSIENFEQCVQSELRTLLVHQLTQEAFQYRRILEMCTPALWIYFTVAAAQSSVEKTVVELCQGLTMWLFVAPCLAKIGLRLCSELQTQCCIPCLDVLLSAGIVASTSLVFFASMMVDFYLVQNGQFLGDRGTMAMLAFHGTWAVTTVLAWKFVRVQSSEQLAALEKENAELKKEASNARMAAAAAARREARVDNISRRHENAAKRGEELAALLACMKAWVGEVVLARSTEALRKEASERLAESLARARLESRGALHRAWSEAAEASRKAAALERRLEGLDAASPTGPLEITRLDGFDGSRPNTAAAIERRLEEADERARRRLSTARSVTSQLAEPHVESLAAEDAPTILGAAEVLQLSSPAERCVQTDFPDDALAARESRKLLFTAALGEQARDCQGRALDGWRRVILQDRCARLEALLSLRNEKAASQTATPRSTSKSSMRSPRPPLAR